MKFLVTEEDFRLVEKAEEDLYGIEILTGDFEKCIFTFGKVSLDQNEERTECKVSFDFKIHQANDKYTIEELNNAVEFKNYISEILSIVLNKWDTHKNDEHPKTDSKENM